MFKQGSKDFFFWNRFREVTDLGEQLLARNPNWTDVKDRLLKLNAEHDAVLRGWNEKGDWLNQCLDLQLFNKEADNIDATTSSHEAFLEFTDLGVCIIMYSLVSFFSHTHSCCPCLVHVCMSCFCVFRNSFCNISLGKAYWISHGQLSVLLSNFTFIKNELMFRFLLWHNCDHYVIWKLLSVLIYK